MTKPYVILNILCGGHGARIGGNKQLYLYDNKPLIEHIITRLKPQCDEIILSLNNPQNPTIQELENFGLDIVYDEFQNRGPMSGVLAGMKYSSQKKALENRDIIYLTTPCDMPLLPDNYVKLLIEKDTASFYSGQRDYPLCAQIPIANISALEKKIKASDKGISVYSFLKSIGAMPVSIENEADFVNINEPIIS